MAASASPLQAFCRFVIMMGTVVVGGMALYLYGPPPEKAAGILQSVSVRVRDLIDQSAGQPANPTEPKAADFPPAVLASPNRLTPLPGRDLAAGTTDRFAGSPAQAAPALYDPNVAQASASGPPTASPRTQPQQQPPHQIDWSRNPQLAPLARELEQLGAQMPKLEPWGTDGRLHRFHCSAALPGCEAMQRHFDAIRATPTEAVSVALAELRQWRGGHQQPITR